MSLILAADPYRYQMHGVWQVADCLRHGQKKLVWNLPAASFGVVGMVAMLLVVVGVVSVVLVAAVVAVPQPQLDSQNQVPPGTFAS